MYKFKSVILIVLISFGSIIGNSAIEKWWYFKREVEITIIK